MLRYITRGLPKDISKECGVKRLSSALEIFLQAEINRRHNPILSRAAAETREDLPAGAEAAQPLRLMALLT